MNKSGSSLVTGAIALTGAVVASALITDATDSWLEFAAWAAFFVALQSPILMATGGSTVGCTAWLARLRNKS